MVMTMPAKSGKRTTIFPSDTGFTRLAVLLVILHLLPACAASKPLARQPEYLHNLACRIVSRTTGPVLTLAPLIDVNLDTLSKNPADYTFGAELEGGRRLDAAVRHVDIGLPRDRFNVSLMLDRKPFVRLSHVDLDIYLEAAVDDRTYILHCFPEFDTGADPDSSSAGERSK